MSSFEDDQTLSGNIFLYLKDRLVGGGVEDHSPHGHAVRVEGGLTEVEDPDYGWCYQFGSSPPGSDGGRRFEADLTCPPAFTFALWIRHEATAEGVTSLLEFDNNKPQFGLELLTQLTLRDGGVTSDRALVVPAELPAATWHHVALTYGPRHPTAPVEQATIYVDGTVVATDRLTLADVGGSTLRIGRGYTSGQTCNGRMAHILIFDRALDAEEIGAVMDGTRGSLMPAQEPASAAWVPVSLSEVIMGVEAELRAAREVTGARVQGFTFGPVSLELGFLPANGGRAAYLPDPAQLAEIGPVQLSTLRLQLEPTPPAGNTSSIQQAGVPDLRGLAEPVARTRLRSLGLLAEVRYQTVPANSALAGLVETQLPAAGEEMAVGSPVLLVVGRAEAAAPAVAAEPVEAPSVEPAGDEPTELAVSAPQRRLAFDGETWLNTSLSLPARRYTLEFWVRVEARGDNDTRYIIGGRDAVSDWSSGELAARLDRPREVVLRSQEAIITPGAWCHVAIVRDDDDKYRRVSFYRDGVLEATKQSWRGGVARGEPGEDEECLRIGHRGDAPDQWLRGAIDEIRVWSSLRSPAQLAASRAQRLTQADGLIACWRTEQSSVLPDGTLPDQSGNGHTARVHGPMSFDEI